MNYICVNASGSIIVNLRMYLDNTQSSNLIGVITWLRFGIDSPIITWEKQYTRIYLINSLD